MRQNINAIVQNQSLRGRLIYPWNKNPLSRDLNTSFNHTAADIVILKFVLTENVGKMIFNALCVQWSNIFSYTAATTINLNEGKYYVPSSVYMCIICRMFYCFSCEWKATLYLRFSFIIELRVKGLNRTDRSNKTSTNDRECSNLRLVILNPCEKCLFELV